MAIHTVKPGIFGPRGSGIGLVTFGVRGLIQAADVAGVTVRRPFMWGFGINNQGTTLTTERLALFEVPRDCNIFGLSIGYGATPGIDTTATVYVNGVATSLTATCANNTIIVADTTHTVAVVRGDVIRLDCTYSTGTPGTDNVHFRASLWLA
jgi:hypothetical protein